MLIHACVSGHGFGHGSRTASVLLELATLQPDWRLVLSTSLSPRFLAGAFGPVPFEHRPCNWDVGVVQADALATDAAGTLEALEALERELPGQIEREAAWLAAQPGPAVVLADVPPAAVRLAERAGLPLIWLGNFGWDDIHGPMGGAFSGWAERHRQLYRRGQALIRCPFAMAMDWRLPETCVGLTAAQPRLDPTDLRQRLELPAGRECCVLVSFGGLGLALGPELFRRWPDHVFLCTDPSAAAAPNVRLLPEGVRPLELLGACGRVISKAGYSTFCEALAQGVGVHLVERHGFAEAEVLERGLRRHGWHRLLSQAQLRSGDWQLDQPLIGPSQGPLPLDGARQAAVALEAFARRNA